LTYKKSTEVTISNKMRPTIKSIDAYSVDDVALWLFCQGMGEAAIASFRQNDIDGGMLATLTQEELVSDLGLTRLQAKKVQRSIEFTNGLARTDPVEIQELKSEVARLIKENEDLKDKISRIGSPPAPEESPIPVTTAVPIMTPSTSTPHGMHGGRANHHTTYTYHTAPTYATTTTHAGTPTSATTYCCTEAASPYVPQTSKPSKTTRVAKGAVTGAAGGAVKGAMKGAIVGAIVPGVSAGEGAKAGAAAGAATGGLKGIVRAARR
jgi:SAM domain (Sterile alpha motif)